MHIYFMRHILSLALLLSAAALVHPQLPVNTAVQILKAEDARRYDASIQNLLTSPAADVRERAALAAGRIGDERAVSDLTRLLDGDSSDKVRTMAAFALGEIESLKGADAVLEGISRELGSKNSGHDPKTAARLVEAAGKIAAANAKDPRAKELGAAILKVLSSGPADILTIRLALTAALRARPEGAAPVLAKYIDHPDANVRADALNALGRLRSKERLGDIRNLLQHDADAVVRANAARVLGAGEGKEVLEALVNAAAKDNDIRVRVSAIRSIGALKAVTAVDQLLARGNTLMAGMNARRSPSSGEPVEKNELLEIMTALAAILANTEDERSVILINKFRMADGFGSPEAEVALAKIAPRAYVDARVPDDYGYRDFHMVTARAHGLAQIAQTKDPQLIAGAGEKLTSWIDGMRTGVRPADRQKLLVAMPELTSALAELKPDNIDEILRGQLQNDDAFVRAAAAGAIADRPVTNENVAALKSAFTFSFVRDKHDDDAMLAVIDALHKLDKKGSVGSLLTALTSPDYLIRKRAFELLNDPELKKDFPGIETSLEVARSKHKDQVLPYSPAFGTKLGQVLNTELDYRRALSRKDGSVRAVLTTVKGAFTIEFAPEEAPLTVDNFVKLARTGYFNGLEVHRVVPNFVVQDGDPRGDGSGGPGWSIRCEINMLPYDRGAVGMALSGKDTGGSQWFVTHSPQPHLDGGYTVFGHVAEKDMRVVDTIVRGDRIINVRIIGR